MLILKFSLILLYLIGISSSDSLYAVGSVCVCVCVWCVCVWCMCPCDYMIRCGDYGPDKRKDNKLKDLYSHVMFVCGIFAVIMQD